MALEATQIRRRRLVRDKLPGTHVTTGRTPAFAFCSLWSSESDILISMWGGMSRHGVPKRCLSQLGVGPIPCRKGNDRRPYRQAGHFDQTACT